MEDESGQPPCCVLYTAQVFRDRQALHFSAQCKLWSKLHWQVFFQHWHTTQGLTIQLLSFQRQSAVHYPAHNWLILSRSSGWKKNSWVSMHMSTMGQTLDELKNVPRSTMFLHSRLRAKTRWVIQNWEAEAPLPIFSPQDTRPQAKYPLGAQQ